MSVTWRLWPTSRKAWNGLLVALSHSSPILFRPQVSRNTQCSTDVCKIYYLYICSLLKLAHLWAVYTSRWYFVDEVIFTAQTRHMHYLTTYIWNHRLHRHLLLFTSPTANSVLCFTKSSAQTAFQKSQNLTLCFSFGHRSKTFMLTQIKSEESRIFVMSNCLLEHKGFLKFF